MGYSIGPLFHQETRATGVNDVGLSSAILNDTIYIFGGGHGSLWSLPIDQINADHLGLASLSPQPNITRYAPQTIAFQDSFIALGGDMNGNKIALQQYNASKSTWETWNAATTAPLNRAQHSAVVTPDAKAVLLFGGKTNATHGANDFWSLSTHNKEWKRLSMPGNHDRFGGGRCGHTASMLSNGLMVVLGGYYCNASGGERRLADLDHALVYDSINMAWRRQELIGNVPASRIFHSAVTVQHDRIMICGGQDGALEPFQTYISAHKILDQMAAMLDTNTWTWCLAYPSPNYQPFPQSMGIALPVDGNKMIYGIGESYYSVHDGLYILDSDNLQWLPQKLEMTWINEKQGNSPIWMSGWGIAALCLSIVLFATMGWIIWRLGRRVPIVLYHGLLAIKKSVWSPRPGEPTWAEMLRLCLRTLFVVYLIYLCFALMIQVINSPIVDQQYYKEEHDYTVDVPDVRFCFDGWDHANAPSVRCSTDFGQQCSQYIHTFFPDTASSISRTCALFRAPSTFRLGPTSNRLAASMGSYLKFDYYGTPPPSPVPADAQDDSMGPRIQMTLYHKEHDPNMAMYDIPGLQQQSSFAWRSEYEEAQFLSTEQQQQPHAFQFALEPHRVHTGSYMLLERIVLDEDSWWNYIGFASDTETRYELDEHHVTVHAEPTDARYSTEPAPYGSVHLFPVSFETKVISEQRAFTLVNALGVVGGMFGLFMTIESALCGFRPRSPLGIFHRWSIGQMRQSLLRGLQAMFSSHEGDVPIVHPLKREPTAKKKPAAHHGDEGIVHDKNDEIVEEDDQDEKSDEKRMERLEYRLHTLERLFQAYYIDDEIFRSLDRAQLAKEDRGDERGQKHTSRIWRRRK